MRWFIFSACLAQLLFGAGTAYAQAADADGDGYDSRRDCDDNDAAVNPGASEVCDGVDNNCDGAIDEGASSTYYIDEDGDGFGSEASTIEACEPAPGYVTNSGDCDDDNQYVYPGAEEICDGLDNDCDGVEDDGIETTTWYADRDDDGAGDPNTSTEDCTQPEGTVANGDDCDDRDPDVQADCDSAPPEDTSDSADSADSAAPTDDSAPPADDSSPATDPEGKDEGCADGCGGSASAAMFLALALAGGLRRGRRASATG